MPRSPGPLYRQLSNLFVNIRGTKYSTGLVFTLSLAHIASGLATIFVYDVEDARSETQVAPISNPLTLLFACLGNSLLAIPFALNTLNILYMLCAYCPVTLTLIGTLYVGCCTWCRGTLTPSRG
jgi:hypothetical protein